MVAWLAGVSVRQAGQGCCADPCIVAAVLEPRRVHLYATAPGGDDDDDAASEGGVGTAARAKILSSFGVCGHDISAVVLDPRHDLAYTVGADHCLRCWNIKSRAQRWSWEDTSAGRDTIGLLTMREPPKPGETGAAVWRRQRNYLRMDAEPRLFVVGDFIWVAGPRALRVFERRTGLPLWDVQFGEDHDPSMCLIHVSVLVTVEEPTALPDADVPAENDGSLELVAYAADRPKRLELWRQPLTQGAGVHWLCAHAGRLHYVSRKGDEQQLVARSIATGIELWHRPHLVAKHGERVSKLEANAGLLFVFSGLVVNVLSVGDGKQLWSLELGSRVDAHRYFICTRCVAVWLPPDPDQEAKRAAKKKRISARQRKKKVPKKQRKMEEETRTRVAAAVDELGDSQRVQSPPDGARVFISDGESVHAVDACTGERLLDWGNDEAGRLKLGSGIDGQPPASLTCIDGGAAGSSDLFILQRRVLHTPAGRHVATSLELRSPESGALRWSEAGARAAGAVALHSGPRNCGVVGSTIVPQVGTVETGHRTLHVFNGSTGDLRAVHKVPHAPHVGRAGKGSRPPRDGDLWRFVPGGVLTLQKKTKSLAPVGPLMIADKGSADLSQRIKGGTTEPEPEPEPEPELGAMNVPKQGWVGLKVLGTLAMPLVLHDGSFEMALDCFSRDKWNDAREAFTTALNEGDARVARCHNGIGLCHSCEGDLEAALVSFDQALELDPSDERVKHNRSQVLSRLGRESEAEAVSILTPELEDDLDLEVDAPGSSTLQAPSKADKQIKQRAPVDVRRDRIEFLAHKRKRKQVSRLIKGHNVTTVSDARLDMTIAAAEAAAVESPKWVWSEKAGKNIEAWTVHGDKVYVLTHDSVVHVLSVSSGKEKRSFRCGENVPSRRGSTVMGGKAMLLHGGRLMLRGVSGCEGRMFDAKQGKELWRPGLAKATKTAGDQIAVLGSTVVISLSLEEIEPKKKEKPATGKLFAKSAKHGGLMWKMSFPVPVLESGSSSSIVTIWPMRVDPVETAAMRSCPISEQQTVGFLRIAASMRLDKAGKYLYLTTRYVTHEARGGESRYHVRCFDAVRSIRKKEKGGPWEHDISAMSPGGARGSGERWHYPDGLPHEGLRGAIQSLEVTEKALVVGCESGHIHMLHPKTGKLMASIDTLHLEEVTSFANPGGGLVWTASSHVAVMRLRPLERFGVVAAIEQIDMPSKTLRVSKLYLVTFEFWAHLLMVLLEAVQLLRFAFLARVECADAPRWVSSTTGLYCSNYTTFGMCNTDGTAGAGWDSDAWGSFADDQDENGVAPTEVCCSCKGEHFLFASLDIPGLPPMEPMAEDIFGADSNTTESLIHLPSAYARVLAAAHAEGFSFLDGSQRSVFVWAFWGCVGAVLMMVCVVLLSEPLKRRAFFYPHAKSE
jgi:hypothetical protein